MFASRSGGITAFGGNLGGRARSANGRRLILRATDGMRAQLPA